jgi:hypothetical protein
VCLLLINSTGLTKAELLKSCARHCKRRACLLKKLWFSLESSADMLVPAYDELFTVFRIRQFINCPGSCISGEDLGPGVVCAGHFVT